VEPPKVLPPVIYKLSIEQYDSLLLEKKKKKQ
jgi:hypothetical protein